MKKTKKFLLTGTALAVIASSSAFAGGINLIKSNDITVNMNGDIDLRIINKDDKEGTQFETNFDDLDFTFKYKINDRLKFIAETDWTLEYENGEGVENDGAWVGVETDYGLLRAGFQTNSFDPLGIDNSEMFDNGMASGDIDGGGTNKESSIVYEFERGDYWLSATYTVPEDKNDGDDDTVPEIMQFVAIYDDGPLEIGGGIGKTITFSNDSVTYNSTYAQAQVEFKHGDITIGLLAGFDKQEKMGVTTKTFEIESKYKVNKKIYVMAGFEQLSQNIDDVSSISSYENDDNLKLTFLGMTYKFNKYVKLYTELGTKKGSMVRYGKGKQEQWDQNLAAIELGVDF